MLDFNCIPGGGGNGFWGKVECSELKLEDSLYGSDNIEFCLSDVGGFILPIDTGVALSLLDGIWFGRDEVVGEIDWTGASDIG
jgi:hypothetical protein